MTECRRATRYRSLYRYAAVIKLNDMSYPAKPVAMNVRFNADCIGLFEDHAVLRIVYPADSKNRSNSSP